MSKKKKTLDELLIETLVPEDEQPYEVPENWVWTNLGGIVHIKTGKKDANFADENGLYPFFTCSKTPSKSPSFSYDEEALLIPGNGNIGTVMYYRGQFEAYQRTYIVTTEGLNLKYLYYHMLYSWGNFNKDKLFGSTISYIKLANLQKYPVAIAPLAIQRDVVNKIENLFSKIDEAKQLIDEAKENFELRRAAILDKAFKGALSSKYILDNEFKSDKAYIENSLFEIPKDWKWVVSGALFIEPLKNGYSPKSTEQETTTKTLKLGAITKGYFINTEFKYINESIDETSSLWLKKGDFLIQRANSIEYVGTAAIYTGEDKEFIYPDLIMKGKLNEALVIPQFLVLWINSMYGKSYIKENATGTAGNMPKINQKVANSIPVPLPPLEEQKVIMGKLENLLSFSSKSLDLCNKALLELANLKHSILSKAFKGELGTNDPTDKPAIELLKSILQEKL